MLSRLYVPIKPIAKRIGIHQHLRGIYDNYLRRIIQGFSLAEYLCIVNREELRRSADTVYEYSSTEDVHIPELSEIKHEGSDIVEQVDVDNLHRFEQPFIAEINGGLIINNSGFSTTTDYLFILDAANSRESRVRRYYRSHRRECLRVHFHQRFRTRSRDADIEVAVPLIRNPRPDGNRYNYYHWIEGWLTKLEGIVHYQQRTGISPTIVIENDPPTWLIESLELLGFKDQIYHWDFSRDLYVEKLIVPSVRKVEEWQGCYGVNHEVISKQACHWLRKRAVERCDLDNAEFSEKVFISRADAISRRINNREEIMECLAERGFESYELTDLTFQEQVTLFSQAKEVIGAHGAGLTNILFSSDCKVTEIVGGSYKPTYYILSSLMDHEYRLIVGDSIDEPDVKLHNQDIYVDPAVLL